MIICWVLLLTIAPFLVFTNEQKMERATALHKGSMDARKVAYEYCNDTYENLCYERGRGYRLYLEPSDTAEEKSMARRSDRKNQENYRDAVDSYDRTLSRLSQSREKQELTIKSSFFLALGLILTPIVRFLARWVRAGRETK